MSSDSDRSVGVAAMPAQGRSRWQRVADAIELPENPETQIYGTITTGALLAAESDRHETFWQVGGSVALALIVVWFAHAYATGVATRMHSGGKGPVRNLVRSLVQELALLRGAFVPLMVLLLAGAAGASVITAETAALISAAAVLVVLELLVGLRSDLRLAELAVQVLFSALVGLGVLALRVVVH